MLGHSNGRKSPTFLNTIKTKFLLHNIKELSPYLTGNTLRLRYKAQQVRTIRNTQTRSVGRMQSSALLKQVVYIVTIGL
jgi:hypothetical protein